MMIAASLPPHFWDEAVSVSTYLINIQPSTALQGGIPLERLSGRSPNYSALRLFGCVCYVFLASRERSKLTAQSVECVFLGYSDEHKGYRCWDPVDHRMRISWDVTVDKSRPFYSGPSSSTFSVEDISFLMFPDSPPSVPQVTTPPSPPMADLPPSSPTSSSSPSSPHSLPSSPISPSSPTVISPFPFHYSRHPRDHDDDDAPDMPYTSGVSSSPPHNLRARPRPLPDRYSPTRYGLSAVLEPTSYSDVVPHPKWQLAVTEKIATLERTGTWDVVTPPPSVRPTTCKWVYKIKTRSDGYLERYKALLVARGFQQEQSRDYDGSFALVAHMTTVRTLLAVASVCHWSVSRLDVKNAFLNGELREEVYMQPPPGAHDPALFVYTSSRGRTLLLHVDDMIITGDDFEYIAFVKACLREQFLMTDLGPLRYFLGIEDSSTSDGFYISQEKYIKDLLTRAALEIFFARKFACTGVFIECDEFTTKIMTSASLVRSGDGKNIHSEWKIEVCLPSKQRVDGTLQHYDLKYNVAVVSIKGVRSYRAANLDEMSQTEAGAQVVALGRGFESGKLMATEGTVTGKRIRSICEELQISTCKITKAGIGGPLVDFDGNFVGMNFFDTDQTPYLSRVRILELMKCFNAERTVPVAVETPDNSELPRGQLAMPDLLFLLFLFSFSIVSASTKQQGQVYIVNLGEHAGARAKEAILEDHHALLLSVKGSEEEARASLLYSYKHTLNGFAALLSGEEATKLSERTEVVSTYRSDGRWSPHTTRSWEFVGFEEGLRGLHSKERLPSSSNAGENVIVGMLDSGIWPESKSFGDEGLGPVPARWKGVCQGGDSFNSSSCNRKIIGARYYLKAYEAHHGSLNTTYAFRSPRDHDGHGTHTASTVAGRTVPGVSALGGFASGTASGGAPLARLAIYKVCWPIPGPNPNIENTCFDADMLAAMDDAVGDGVDVMSVSIGASGKPPPFANDGIAVGALHAARCGVVVVCSGGNSGPAPATVSNLAPWILTVGASSIDRSFNSRIRLGDGRVIMGQTVTPYQLPGNKTYQMVYAAHAAVPGTPANVTNQCLPNSLSPAKVRGKIVVCLRGSGLRVGKGLEVKRAGGAAMVLGNPPMYGSEVPVDAHVLPGTAVSNADVDTILKYISSSANPTAYLYRSRTVVDVRPSPVMAQFSSRGPNVVEPSILKPDVTAPGLNILAAWSEASSPTKLDGDDRVVKYNIVSGTSMSCPHVAATAVLLKAAHPDWSAAAIRSAIMTTATTSNAEGGPIMNGDGTAAGPMDYGSGHIRPKHALDPGLVYDASFQDYLLFACSSGGGLDRSFPCPASPPRPHELNHPSLSLHGLNGSVTVRRTVTNVGQHGAHYSVAVVEPPGVSVKVSPASLSFARTGEKQTFEITVEAKGRMSRKYLAGSYTWSDGVHVVSSPIVVLLP
ncbi:hypothetical protein ACQ4PT_037075 [Festuca glaucescens]